MNASSTPVASEPRRVLLFGGGGCHLFAEICPVLKGYLDADPNLRVDYVQGDLDVFTAERIAPYDLIVLYHTGGQLNAAQERGLCEGIAAGKGFVGIHSAADSFRESAPYRAMLGGNFRAHPCMRDYTVSLPHPNHPACAGIAGFTVKDWEKWPVFEYTVHDEQYLVDHDARAEVIATAAFRGTVFPVAWVKGWGRGKVFYLALGHHADGCRFPIFKDLFTGGVRWVAAPGAYTAPPTDAFSITWA